MAGPLNPLDVMRAQFLKWRNSNNPSANNNGVLSTDPSMMEDAELNRMSFQRPPALSQPTVNNTSPHNREAYIPPGASNNTGNARGSSISRPDDQIGFNEMMIRTGGAMMGGARDGGLAAMNAATDEYGNIQDANRTNALNAYDTQMTALQKANAAASKTSTEDKEILSHAGSKLSTVKQAIAGLKQYPNYTTGPGAGSIVRAKDKMSGHPRENLRLLMQSIKVDATLANTAKTKGAISDKEMALFMSPIPSFYVDEKIWMRYLLDYEAALTNMYTALGGSVDSGSSGGSSSENDALDAEVERIINQ